MPITSTDKRPHTGARFELDLLSRTEAEVRYRAQLHLPAGRTDHVLAISLDEGRRGTCTLVRTGGAGEPPPQVEGDLCTAHLLALGRQLYRSAEKDGTWQRRLMRWRPER